MDSRSLLARFLSSSSLAFESTLLSSSLALARSLSVSSISFSSSAADFSRRFGGGVGALAAGGGGPTNTAVLTSSFGFAPAPAGAVTALACLASTVTSKLPLHVLLGVRKHPVRCI